jgi:N-acetylglutamate synthase-like GNAT family acetyltransferase
MTNFEIQAYEPAIHGSLEHLCAETKGKGVQMLELTPQKITEQSGRFVTVHDNEAVAYCAQTVEYGDSVVEIGSLIVGQSFRGLGLSVPLVETTTINAIASGKKAIAFCNSISEKVFARVGYEPMKICKIPQEALTLCSECPKKLLTTYEIILYSIAERFIWFL